MRKRTEIETAEEWCKRQGITGIKANERM